MQRIAADFVAELVEDRCRARCEFPPHCTAACNQRALRMQTRHNR